MPESTPATPRIRFADFEADLESKELFRQGAVVRLPNQSFLALAALLERPGQLVTREELRARLWPNNRVVEFEQGLNAIINRLREVLGDNAENPVFIETLPRRGYRFVGQVTRDAGPAAPVTAARPAFPRHAALAAGAILALSVAAFLVWRTREGPARADPVAPLTTLVGQERMPALSPDGTRIVFAWDGESAAMGGGFDLYARSLDSERLTQLTRAPAAGLSASWSPDGTRIAFARMGGENSGVFVMPATGGVEQKLIAASFTQESLMQPSWSPDGEMLAFSAVAPDGSHHLRLLTLADQVSRELERAPECWHAGAPAFSSDGKQLAFLCMTSIAVYGVYVVETNGGAPRKLASRQGFPQGLAWAANGKRLLIANDSGDGGGIWELELDGTLHAPRVAEESVGPGLSARAGRLVYTRARQVVDIWQVSPDGAAEPPRKWIFSTRAQLTPQYSPDGSRIAFQSNRSGSPEIWLSDADGSNAVRLTKFNGPLTGGPSWCSDGRRLAFDSRASGASAVYVVDTLEGVPREVATSKRNLALPVWSADCRWLLASDGREALYRVPADGGEAQHFTTQRSYQAAVVGDRVIFNVAEPAGVALWSKPLGGGAEAALPGMPRLAYADAWAANDQAIYFTDSSRLPVIVRRYEFGTGAIVPVATLPHLPTALGGLGMAVSRDGKSVLYTRTEDTQSDLVLMGNATGLVGKTQ